MKRVVFLVLITVLVLTSLPLFAGGQKESADEVNLVYWSMWNETEPQAMVLKKAIADFEDKNAGVNVDIQWNGREIRKTLQPALDAGTKIDIWDEDLERIVKTWQSYAISLDSYYDQVFPTTGGKAFKDTTMGSLQSLLKSFSTDGEIYAVPYQPMVLVVFYNKDHFKKAGITKAPVTWDEYLDVCAKLKSAGFTPMTLDDAYMELPLGLHLNRVFGNFADVEALAKDKTGKLWDDPRVLQTAKAFENLANSGYISVQLESNKWPAGQQEVATDQVSMYMLNGTWLPNEVKGTTGPDFPWGQFAYPVVDSAIGSGGGTYGSQGFQISKDCENPDAAFALLAHLTTGSWDKEMAANTLGAPMDTSMPWPEAIEDCKVVFEGLDSWIPWSGGLAADTDAFPVIKAEYTNLLAGKITAEEFIAVIKAKL